MNLPYFNFYPRDWLADTGHLTYEQRGIYFDLLCHMWVHGDNCTLPDDTKLIANLLHIPPRKWKEARAALVDSFAAPIKVIEGRLYSKRLQSEHEKAGKKSQARSEAANSRWRADSPSDAIALQMQSKSNADDTQVSNANHMHPEAEPESELTLNSKSRESMTPPGVEGEDSAQARATASTATPTAKVPPGRNYPEEIRQRLALQGQVEHYGIEVRGRPLSSGERRLVTKFFNEHQKLLTLPLIEVAADETIRLNRTESLAYFFEVMRRMMYEPDNVKPAGRRSTNGASGAGEHSGNGHVGHVANDRHSRGADAYLRVQEDIDRAGTTEASVQSSGPGPPD